MNKEIKKNIKQGIDNFCKLAKNKKRLYSQISDLAKKDKSSDPIYRITENELFKKVISSFGPILEDENAEQNLNTVYEAALHKKTGALIICNKGATLFSYSPKNKIPHLIRHIGFCLYIPGLGIEMVNIGIVGDIYSEKLVLRCESACTPSFLFGSQRCNCAHQWDSIREIAAAYNPIEMPDLHTGSEFESWVQDQLEYKNGKHEFKQKGPGFILMHLDTQNGMGSGFSKDQFAFDLYTRASLRHRGEYSSEQIHKTTMAGGFKAIGLEPDPRKENGELGYKPGFIILDYLQSSKNIVFLTNNPLKVKNLTENGYQINRVPLMGEINIAGSQEAEQRGSEFDHWDINGCHISFEEECERLKKIINEHQ